MGMIYRSINKKCENAGKVTKALITLESVL